VLGIAASGKKPTETQSDRASGDFRKTGNNNNARGRNSTRQSSSQGKGDGKTVRHADNNIAHEFTAGEVSFGVRSLRHRVLLQCWAPRKVKGFLAEKVRSAVKAWLTLVLYRKCSGR